MPITSRRLWEEERRRKEETGKCTYYPSLLEEHSRDPLTALSAVLEIHEVESVKELKTIHISAFVLKIHKVESNVMKKKRREKGNK
jgi:hypothetical protein